MTYNKKTLRDMDVSNQKVLLRCDLAGDAQAALPTLRHLLDAGAAVIVCAGEPGGEALCAPSMAAALGEMLGCTAAAAADAAGPDAMEKAAALPRVNTIRRCFRNARSLGWIIRPLPRGKPARRFARRWKR